MVLVRQRQGQLSSLDLEPANNIVLLHAAEANNFFSFSWSALEKSMYFTHPAVRVGSPQDLVSLTIAR